MYYLTISCYEICLSVVNPLFPRYGERRTNPKSYFFFGHFSRKLHKIEKNWTEMGRLLLDPPMSFMQPATESRSIISTTRMHSSRMRTACLLTVSQHALLGMYLPGGVPAQGGGTCLGGVPAWGVPAKGGCTCPVG